MIMNHRSTGKDPPTPSDYFFPVLEIGHPDQPLVTVVPGTNDSGHEEADRIIHAIQNRYGVRPPVLPGDQTLKKCITPHAIVIGCLADNPVIEALYFRWYTLVDRWYPGPGGYVIQMCPSPYIRNHHVLILGGSDAKGVSRATDQFLKHVETNTTGRFLWQLEVQLGVDHVPLPEDRLDILGTSTSPLFTPESILPDLPYSSGYQKGTPQNHLLRLGMYGPHADNFHLSRSSQLGLRYLYTGDIEDARTYRGTLLEEVNTGVLEQLYHYKSLRMFQLWAMLAPCSVFGTDDQDIINGAIYTYLLEESGIANIDALRNEIEKPNIFNRHHACDALNLWVGTDMMWRQSGEEHWLEKRSVADAYFEAQRDTDVPLTGLTEGYASYLEVALEWMLMCCPDRITQDPHMRLWAERVMGLCTNAGQLVLGPQTDGSRYPYNLLRKLTYLFNDGRFLYVANLRLQQVTQGMDRVVQFSAGQAYTGDVEPQEPRGDIGLKIYPMNERLRRWKAPSIKAGEGFDRVVARGGWGPNDEYLMVIGVRSGAKSLPNVGSLAAYERFGQRLITSNAIALYPDSVSPWRHSSVTVNISGAGRGMAEGCEELTRRSACGGKLFSYQTDYPGMYRWTRILYWRPEAYVLIVDQVSLVCEQAYTMSVNWRCAGPVSLVDDLAVMPFSCDSGIEGRFFIQSSDGRELSIECDSYPIPGAPPGTCPLEENILHATSESRMLDREMKVATLLHAVDGSTLPTYTMYDHEHGWLVQGPEQALLFTPDDRVGDLKIEDQQQKYSNSRPIPVAYGNVPISTPSPLKILPTLWRYPLKTDVSVWTQDEDGTFIAVGDKSGQVIVINNVGKKVWSGEGDAEITALVFFEGDLIVGTRSGRVHRFDIDGKVVWRYTCRFRTERAFWPWWFMDTPLVGALTAGRDGENGQTYVAVGTGSTSLNFLDAQTGQLIADILSPYGLPDRLRSYRSPKSGRLSFLSAHGWLTCGSTVRVWHHPFVEADPVRYYKSIEPHGRTLDEWDTCGVRDFWIGSLVPNEPVCLLVLRHGAVNQLTAYDHTSGTPLWDIGLGGVPVAMAVVQTERSEDVRVHIVDKSGWLNTSNGTGKQIFAHRMPQDLNGIIALSSDLVAMWNKTTFIISRMTESSDQYHLTGIPLGWIHHSESPGILCVDKDHLVMKTVDVS
jgi:hypothetical protein